MALDSAAYFSSRVSKVGLGDFLPAMQEKGWDTMGNFAFSAKYVPGAQDDTSFVTKVVIPLLGAEDLPQEPALRRLHFEAYTLAIAEGQRLAAGHEDDAKPRKLPAAERTLRMEELKVQLAPAVEVSGSIEPSHILIDKFASMVETGELRFISWQEYTSRGAEVKGVKVEEAFKPLPNGEIRVVSKTIEEPANITGEFKVQNALKRRGVAMHVAKLLNYQVHEELLKWYFTELEAEPVPGFSKISISQVMEADSRIFMRLAEITKEDLSIRPDGTFALDGLLRRVLLEPRTQLLLAPSRMTGSSSSGQKRDAEIDRLMQENKRLKASFQMGGKGNKGKDSAAQYQQKGGKGKGGNKNKKGKGEGRMPRELVGLKAEKNGVPLCFDFNLAGCSKAGNGSRCGRGLHVCMKCGSSTHGARGCTIPA